MSKIINADLYKSFHRVYVYVLMAVMVGASIFVNSILAYNKIPLESSFGLALSILVFPLFFISMFADIITAEENKEHTMKNTISFGVSRNKFFIAKNISAVLVAVAVAVVTLAAYTISAWILLKPEKNDMSAVLSDFAIRIGVAMLLYVAAAVLATFLAAVIKRNAMFTFAYFGALILPVYVFKLLNLVNPFFAKVQNVMLFMQVQIIAGVPQAQLINSVWVALVQIAVFAVLGLIVFRRQEIN